MNAHDQWALYLDPDTHPDVRAEIGSDLGEQETDALDRVGGILADEAAWGEPSAGLREQLLAQARAEKEAPSGGLGSPDHVTADRPPADSPLDELAERRARRRRTGWIGGGLAAAAAAVVAFLLVASPLDDADDGNFTTYEVAGTALTPDLNATVDVEPQAAGVAITLNIEGLPPAEEGTYYAAWLMPDGAMDSDAMPGDDADAMADDDDAMADDSMAGNDADAMAEDAMGDMADMTMVGIGSFHWREGGIPIELWSGVDTDRFPIFIVTLQNEDDPPIASDIIVMTGRLTGG